MLVFYKEKKSAEQQQIKEINHLLHCVCYSI